VSIVCPDELAAVATALDVPRVAAEWIGANLIVTGLPQLSMVPPRTRLVFAGGAVLRVDGQNAPCRLSGRSIAARYPDVSGLDTRFPAVAKRLRGLVAWVEKPGRVLPGEALEAFVPEQWLY
jgi:MOSC domain-containing protein YiiM